MLIRNVYSNGYLVRRVQKNDEGKHGKNEIFVSNNIVNQAAFDQAYTISGIKMEESLFSEWDTQWYAVPSTVLPCKPYDFFLKQYYNNETLFAAPVATGSNDKQSRRVYSWKNGKEERPGVWRFEQQRNGHYVIKNEEYDEYLFADESGGVYTCKVGRDIAKHRFMWELLDL